MGAAYSKKKVQGGLWLEADKLEAWSGPDKNDSLSVVQIIDNIMISWNAGKSFLFSV